MPNPSPTKNLETHRPRFWPRFARGALRWIEHGFALLGAFVVLYWLTLDVSVMTSTSMTPTLQGTSYWNGDHILTEKVTHWFRTPRRWEVITIINDEGVRVMKRVVAFPGETVQLSEDGGLLISGQPMEGPEALDRKYLRFGNLSSIKPFPVGDGYYVLGDDTKDSDDSRFNGSIRADRIVGRAWLIVYPFSRFGFVSAASVTPRAVSAVTH
jgi:signal peptidase I